VAVASQQVEVFSKVLKTSITKYVEEGIESKSKNLKEIIVRSYQNIFRIEMFIKNF
jgi:hypothetical protein